MKDNSTHLAVLNALRAHFAELQARWREPAITVLTILLVVEIFIIAPLHTVGFAPFLLIPVIVPVLVAAVIVVSDNIAAVLAVFVGIGLASAATVLHLKGSSITAIYLQMIAGLVVTSALFWVVARAVFAPGRITYHRIVGTLLLYLAIGTIFASAYGIIGLLVPHAFHGMPPRQDATATVAHVLYFSFSALTTAGFGDITPDHPVTRGLSNLEAVVGQLFPATVIARIVTLHITNRDA